MTITKTTYDLFSRYGGELLWLDDPVRNPRPIGTNKKTDKEFIILSQLDEVMNLFHNGNYSEKLKTELAEKINLLRPKVSNEVFILIEEKNKTAG